jgi:dipeptidyl-peptidase 4
MRLVAFLLFGSVAVLGCADKPANAPPSRSLFRQMQSVKPESKEAAPVAIAPASASKVTFARIAKYPEPGLDLPRGFQHAPDGKTMTYLASESHDETMSLFSFDPATGKRDVLVHAKDFGEANAPRSREEELRRERQRERAEGVTSHIWAKRAKLLVLPHGGDIWVRDPAGAVKQLTKTPDPEIDPKPCDGGERIAFVRKGELWSIDVATGREAMLSTPAKQEGVTHGLSDFVAQEELGEQSGHFWSPKCDRIVMLEVDDRPVDKVPVLGYRGAADLMMQRYPRAGTKNPIVRAGIVDVATKRTTWLAWPKDQPEQYIGRFTWAPDGETLYAQTLTRDQKKLALVRIDPKTGQTTPIVEETSPAWVTFSPIKVLKDTVILTSTKTGHRHIEVRSRKDGALVKTLTSGDWDVDALAAADETRVLFTATKESPIERHLYAASMSGGEPQKLTDEPGVHAIKADEAGASWVDVHSATNRPPRVVFVQDGKKTEIARAEDPEIAALDLRPVEHVTIPVDGETLHGALLKPRKVTGRHPVVVMVYGGPESQTVWNSWSPRLLWQHLADRGFVVFALDGRGTGGRGRGLSQKVHKQLGKLELEDQVAGAAWLSKQPFVDPLRIGIYGHSYGGFMAALAMLDGKGVFKVGVAGAPVTDWSLYDTGYTERYMETPQSNAAGYAASDLSKKAATLSGRLFLIHAMMDENVHYAHTAKLIDALIAAEKPFDLLVLPGERHGTRAPAAKVYVPERVAQYFATHL